MSATNIKILNFLVKFVLAYKNFTILFWYISRGMIVNALKKIDIIFCIRAAYRKCFDISFVGSLVLCWLPFNGSTNNESLNTSRDCILYQWLPCSLHLPLNRDFSPSGPFCALPPTISPSPFCTFRSKHTHHQFHLQAYEPLGTKTSPFSRDSSAPRGPPPSTTCNLAGQGVGVAKARRPGSQCVLCVASTHVDTFVLGTSFIAADAIGI